MGLNSIGGDILPVQGGGVIVRSTARKDCHSKVYTAKGLRDRRVRLSAHTAIQFYDVQDRLGYDRPSKAVDWLINKAKSAIDRLSELPQRNPNGSAAAATETDPNRNGIDFVAEQSESSRYNNFLLHGQLADSLIPPPLDSAVGFQSYQNLGLSLQTLQDTAVNLQIQNSSQNDHETILYTAGSGNSTLGFDDSFEKMVAWNNNAFGSQPLLNPSFPQRGPLQSSLDSPVSHYTWNDLSTASAGKRLPTHEHSSPSIARFISGGLPQLDVQGRFQSDGDGGKESSHSSSYSRH